jgi:hypothetical protein
MTISNPTLNPKGKREEWAKEILSAVKERTTGEWYCSMALEDGHELQGWFKDEREGKTYLEQVKRLTKTKAVKDPHTATHRKSKAPDSAGKKLYPVKAYYYPGDDATVEKIDLRTNLD